MPKAPSAKKTPSRPRGKKKNDELPLNDGSSVDGGSDASSETSSPRAAEESPATEAPRAADDDSRHEPMFEDRRRESDRPAAAERQEFESREERGEEPRAEVPTAPEREE